MFWGFVARLFVGSFLVPFAFGLLLIPLMWLMSLTMRGGDQPRATPLTYPAMALTGIAQLYFWGLWAAYCAALVVSRTATPGVTHKWLYYLVAFVSLTSPFGYMMHKEQVAATQRQAQSIASGTMFYSGAAIVAFAVFVFWPGLIQTPYGWANVILAPLELAETASPAQQALEERYLADLDAWVARGAIFREGEKVDEAAVQARVRPALETCRKLVTLTATPGEKAEFSKTDNSRIVQGRYDEYDMRVDVCTSMTINRVHAQPNFQKPDLVRMVCDESRVSVYRRLCVRSGLRP